jgi:von Willebrand factor type A domain
MLSATKYPVLVLALAFYCAAQQSPANRPCTPEPILVSVVDLHGRPQSNLEKINFEVKVDKKIVELKAVTYKVQPSRMVVLLDTSGSMGGSRGSHEKWAITRSAVQEALTVPAPQVPIALIAFSDTVYKTYPFGGSRSAMLSWVDSIDPTQRSGPHGKTALRDAVAAADQLLDPHQEGDVIYAITDGGENDSKTTTKGVQSQLLRNHVRLYTFLLAEHTPIDEEWTGKQDFGNMVVNTGGFLFGEASRDSSSWATPAQYSFNNKIKDGIAGQTAMLIAQTAAFYRVELVHPEALKEGSNLSVSVIGGNGKKRADLLVRYPKKFFPCGPPSVSP